MARAHFADVAVDPTGSFLATAIVTVRPRGDTSTLAVIYATESAPAPMANPYEVNDGIVSHWADAGAYDVYISDIGIPPALADRKIGWGAVPGVAGGIPGSLIADQGVTGSKIAPASIDFTKLDANTQSRLFPPFVSALPTLNLYDGQEVYYRYQDPAGSWRVWHLKYDANAVTSYKWQFVGGGPVFTVRSGTAHSGATASVWAAFNVLADTAVVLPLAGDYGIDFGARITQNSSGNDVEGRVGVSANNNDPSDGRTMATSRDIDLNAGGEVARYAELINCPAGMSVTLRAFTNGFNAVVQSPWKKIAPLRVG